MTARGQPKVPMVGRPVPALGPAGRTVDGPKLWRVYFLVDRERKLCKIGVSHNTRGRFNEHRGSYGRWEFRLAICGDRSDEAKILRHFSDLLDAGTTEQFVYTGALREYVETARMRPWGATTLEGLEDIYASPGRFPWNYADPANEQLALDAVLDAAPPVGARERLRRAVDPRVKATIRSETADWTTPPLYVNAARRALGEIDLDPASSAVANLVVRATAIYTPLEDGLRRQWHGRIWLNPPQGNRGRWTEHCLREWTEGRVTAAIISLSAQATDTLWFQAMFNFPICFTHHRPHFVGGPSAPEPRLSALARTYREAKEGRSRPSIGPSGTPTGGAAFVYVGPDVERFRSEFSVFGPITPPAWPASCSAQDFRRDYLGHGRDWREAAP